MIKRTLVQLRSALHLRSVFYCSKPTQPQSLDYESFYVKPEEQDKFQAYAILDEYKQGLEFLSQGKNRLALQFFKRFKTYLETNDMSHTKEWTQVAKQIALTNNSLRKYEEAEVNFEEIIEYHQKQKSNDVLVFAAYNDLFLHCLKTNLNKAILLGKALLSNKERYKIPLMYQKLFLYNLGTAYLLKENYTDAKARLRECLQAEPSNMLKGWALNNLAVASWWHKFPSLKEFVSDDEETDQTPSTNDYSMEDIDKDFEHVIPLLKRAIHNIENSQKVEWLLEDSLIPNDHKAQLSKLLISNKYSGKPLLNLSEFLFNKVAQKKVESQFWFKYTLKFYEKQDLQNMDRSLIFLAWMCSTSNQFERAEILYRNTLQMLENTDSYNKVLCLQLLGSMLKKLPNRESEGEKLIIQAYQLAEDLPFWSNRLVHVIVPDIE